MISINLHKTYGQSPDFLMDINQNFQEGNLVALYGPSGSGKTSLLRMVAGLSTPDSGSLMVGDTEWFNSEKKINLRPQKRQIGMVFQDYALFPTMTVLRNLNYAKSKASSMTRVEELIDIFELKDLLHRYPDTLSGGQKQRVALARALAGEPKILLLDEPMSAVDISMRAKLQDYILTVHHKYKLTTFLVSHEPGEILKMADQMVVMDKGLVKSVGSPRSILDSAKISGKFKFIGEVIDIQKQDVVFLVSVRVNNDTVKIIADPSEIDEISIGSKVLVASKAFNPIISRIGD